MTKILLSIFMIMTIVIKANNVESSESISIEGYVRTAYEAHHVIDDKTYNDGAIGGKIHIETVALYHLSLGASFYSSNAFRNGENRGLVPFRGEVANGYALLGEAYINVDLGNTLVKLGRQEINTPFADTDDIGMVPNTFEAYVIENHDIIDTHIFLAQIQKMAGVDAEVIDAFTSINGTRNMQVLGLSYEGISDVALSAWYYHIKDAEVDSITYVEASYESSVETVGYSLALQYAKQTYSLTDDVSVYGLSTSVQHAPSGLKLGFAYNKAKGNAAFSGFGGGPFFSNSEYLIIDNAGKNGSQTWIGVELDASALGVEGLLVSLGYATLKNEEKNKAHELDFVASYEVSKQVEIHLIASHLQGSNIGEDDAKHLRVFANYNF